MESNLSVKLKALRKSFNYTTLTVSKKLSKNNYICSVQTIYKWEDGTSTPSLNAIFLLSRIYKCDINYLIAEKTLTYINLSEREIFLLRLYREDYMFRNIALMIIEMIRKYTLY